MTIGRTNLGVLLPKEVPKVQYATVFFAFQTRCDFPRVPRGTLPNRPMIALKEFDDLVSSISLSSHQHPFTRNNPSSFFIRNNLYFAILRVVSRDP